MPVSVVSFLDRCSIRSPFWSIDRFYLSSLVQLRATVWTGYTRDTRPCGRPGGRRSEPKRLRVYEGARLDEIARVETLAEAWGRVKANKGGPGGELSTVKRQRPRRQRPRPLNVLSQCGGRSARPCRQAKFQQQQASINCRELCCAPVCWQGSLPNARRSVCQGRWRPFGDGGGRGLTA